MNESAISQLYLKETAFQDLMQKRIFNVLLIASPYDAFMMEEDGRVEEQLYFEYVSLNLSSPPRVQRVSHVSEALDVMSQKNFDLVIAMPGVDISETFDGAAAIKTAHPDVPFVVLTPFSKEVSRRLANQDLSHIDFVFSWLGNVDLLLAILKLLEDRDNAEADVLGVGVQAILLVEDSVRFYSSVLPSIYRYLLKQSMVFSTEALNAHEQMLRMRGRPKVILARNYEEAVELYEKYGKNMLGVISDVSFNRQGEKDREAGIKLARYIRERDPYIPIIMESSEVANADKLDGLTDIFIDKNSKKLPVDLGHAISDNFGFGDFVIRNPQTGMEIMRLSTLKDLQKQVFNIPDDSLYYHASRNDISRWLYSRALFPVAEVLKMRRSTPDKMSETKQLIFDLIVKYRKMKNRGVVAVFQKDRFDHYSNFARIGDGSLGGKGRGLAFIDSIIKKNPECDNFEGVTISIPRTVVICTDIFDEFMASNNLYPIALSNASDEEILQRFLEARLPEYIREDLLALKEVVDRPLAIRSSSLLEDSHYQPFAGVYSTYMIPNVEDPSQMLLMMCNAIKAVYASVFFAESKAYMTATSNVIDQEKMAVIIQEVVGEYHGESYFPTFSGVGRSLNYYPINDEQPEDGVAQVAAGLGKYIVDGGRSLRFSPKHPGNVLQTSTLDLALRDTQTHLFALKPQKVEIDDMKVDDGFNIIKKNVQEFAGTGALKYVASTYDPYSEMIIDNDCGRGRRVVTFANMLRDKAFPLAESVDYMLTLGQKEMNRPIEIEFAGLVAPNTSTTQPSKGFIYWLQIRPIIDKRDMVDDELLEVENEAAILKCDNALGHGNIENVDTVVYVRTDNFDFMRNPELAERIAKINAQFVAEGCSYILIGPGRWGSSDSSLGIPVKWASISAARLIVECSLSNYSIEPSQGTHFFQNLTSFGVGYFTVNPSAGSGICDIDYLDSQPAEWEDDRLRIVKFEHPLRIAINGKLGKGAVLKPA